MGVDLRRRHVLVPQQFLDRADVVPRLQQMRRERMAQGMAGRRLDDPGPQARAPHRTLQRRLINMVATHQPAARILRWRQRRKHVEPAQLAVGTRVFRCKRVRQPHTGQPGRAIPLMDRRRPRNRLRQRLRQPLRQRYPPIPIALPRTHGDLVAIEIDILHPQADAFHQAQARPIQQRRLQPRLTVQHRQQAIDLVPRQHHRHPPRSLRTRHILKPRQLQPQHLLVQEQQGRQRLVLRRRRHPPLGRQPGQERLQLPLAQLPRMRTRVGADISPDPRHIRLLRPQAVMPKPTTLAYPSKQTRHPRRIQRNPLLPTVKPCLSHATSHIRRNSQQAWRYTSTRHRSQQIVFG